MAGRWAKLKGRFEETPFTSMTNARDAKFVDKVAFLKKALASLFQKDLLDKFLEVEKRKDELEEQVKEANAELEALSQILKDRFAADGVTSIQTAAGRTLSLKIEPYVSIEDQVAFKKYMAEHPDLDYMWSVNAQTLATYVKELLDKDLEDQIPQCFKVWLKTSISNRKS